MELYFGQVLSWADCSSGQRSVTLLRTALFLKGVGFNYLLHIVTRRIRQHVLSSANSQEAQLLELGTRWKILLIKDCSNGLQFNRGQWILAVSYTNTYTAGLKIMGIFSPEEENFILRLEITKNIFNCIKINYSHRIFCVGRDPQRQSSPVLKWMAHTGIEPTTLMLLAPCPNQLM